MRRVFAVLIATVAVVLSLGVLSRGAFSLGGVPESAQGSVPTITNVMKPSISGVPAVGSVLKANPGTWKGSPPFFFTYYWSSPTTSHLADTRTYTPVASDLGQVLTVHITAQDNNNTHQRATASTPAITTSDVVNTVTPRFTGGLAVGDTATVSTGTFTSGSGDLTYSYAWSRTSDSSSTPLSDTGPTHLITAADLGYSFSVVVTARSSTQVGSVTAQTSGVVIPTAPFPTGNGLTSANKGALTSLPTKNLTFITVPTGEKGSGVFVYGYSSPTPLGWYALDANRTFSVDFGSLTAGKHKLAVLDQTGKLVGWVTVTRLTNPGPFAGLVNSPIALAALAVIVLGAIVIVLGAVLRRRRSPRR